MTLSIIENHSFFSNYINNKSIIVDLGANAGRFSHAMIKNFNCHCYAVEPSPITYELIPSHELLSKFNIAISGTEGQIAFYVTSNSESSSLLKQSNTTYTDEINVYTKPLESFIAEIGVSYIDLLKVDIEGAEVAMFNACSDQFLKRISQICIEFHDFNNVVSESEVRHILNRFIKLGFYPIKMSRKGYGDTLLVNRKAVTIQHNLFYVL